LARRKILLLDVMETLVHEPYFVEVPAYFGMSLAELQATRHPHAWLEFERGEIGEAEFLGRFFADGRPFDHAGLVAAVRRAYRWLPGMERLLAALAREGHEIHALSNYPQWYGMIEERLGLSRFLAWSFVSCNTGIRKPDPRAFTGAAEALGVPSEACLFVDDRPVNCAAARAVGMQALEFRSASELAAELARRGLLAAQ
jgi:HAD superfamily hydrolase (TIGR01509 family)